MEEFTLLVISLAFTLDNVLSIRSEHLAIISRFVMPGSGCGPSPLGVNGTDGPEA